MIEAVKDLGNVIIMAQDVPDNLNLNYLSYGGQFKKVICHS